MRFVCFWILVRIARHNFFIRELDKEGREGRRARISANTSGSFLSLGSTRRKKVIMLGEAFESLVARNVSTQIFIEARTRLDIAYTCPRSTKSSKQNT